MKRIAAVGLALLLVVACAEEENDNNANTNNTTNNATNNTNNATNNSNNTANNTNNTANNSNNTNNATNNTNNQTTPPASPDCDALDPSYCSFPWPSNKYLVEDPDRETGFTLSFAETSLPANADGTHVEPAPYRRLDGYGLGSSMIALFPNVDASGLPNEYEVEDSLDEDAQVLVFEDTGDGLERIPYWVDHDLQVNDPALRSLIVHPAVVLKPATRYVTVFRNLQTTGGDSIPRSDAFQRLLDEDTEGDAELDPRQAGFSALFSELESAGVDLAELNLAWDWTTASSSGLHGYMLHMRDEALALDEQGPELTITTVEEFTTEENADTAVRIEGTFEAPMYIDDAGTPKALRIGADGMPESQGTRTVPFWVNIPHSAIDGDAHRMTLYGHGLFGSGRRAWAGFNSRIANTHDLIFFGADLWGMASTQRGQDVPGIVVELSNFPSIGDQLHQGMMEWILLTRAMKERFGTLDEVTTRNITVDNSEVYYSGISQGGIFGPTFVALSPDVTLGHAGVPGNNYSLLLHRSVDFNPFFGILKAAYRNPLGQIAAIQMIQLLWDGTDPVSYLWNLSAEPFDEGVSNTMLWAPARGDFQVTVIANEIMGRTEGLGVSIMENYDVDRTLPLADIATYPHTGSAVVLYDFAVNDSNDTTWRNAWPEPGNLPPRTGPQDACSMACPVGEEFDRAPFGCCLGECCFDAHELPRRRDWHNEQMVHFFKNGGEVIDVCGGDGCTPQ